MVELELLTGLQVMDCIIGGGSRNYRNLAAGRHHKNGWDGDGWHAHIEGFGAERALSLYLGVPHTSAGFGFQRDDDVMGIQVRRRERDTYDLYVWPDEAEDAIWALVTGQIPRFCFQGWAYSWTIRQQPNLVRRGAWGAGAPSGDCYVIKSAALEPPDTFPIRRPELLLPRRAA
jgi:hypothetical protein